MIQVRNDSIPSDSVSSGESINTSGESINSGVSTFTATHTLKPTVTPDSLPATHTLGTFVHIHSGDTIAKSDSVVVKEKVYGVVMDAPVVPEVKARNTDTFGMSSILAVLFLLFCIIGLRFRNNSKYITALLRNLVEIRERSNVFDETVRETSFIVLLNILWCISAGMVLCALLEYTVPDNPAFSFGLPALKTHPSICTAICIGVVILYTCVMALGYFTVGWVFSDKLHAKIWLKGFVASQSIMGILITPVALLLLYYPQWSEALLLTALISFLLAKFIFIWKGFRIFFTQFSSWVLFLYYLCSLEIVPLILTYLAACQLCSLL